MEDAHKQIIIDLSCLQVQFLTIAKIVGVHARTVAWTVIWYEARGNVGRLPRGPLTNKKRISDFKDRIGCRSSLRQTPRDQLDHCPKVNYSSGNYVWKQDG
ncbi:unnamed protein product [Lepeophtheirus salmonis]|uniref:(salmon louse) hypothetical protein n=1 Tax=Lepeophtheirus salmonis TaxID=72036 RepID=A0A7R8D653_LEPSM|nr:unnamed protein product [Lepeophtheirus salmonis]CAF3037602.1 unnamed protein product [Lepeophtheirus salmonis]